MNSLFCSQKRLPALAVLLGVLLQSSGAGAYAENDLFELSLPQLLQIKVTSVSRQVELSRHAPSAIYVITRDDLRRSGVTHLAEVFRMVPGMQVARFNANSWAVDIRDASGQYANRMLVLRDGRILYNSLFSGVFWNIQDTLLEDVERIEIIRGPGAVMWGSNATNGIINIITRKAKDTTGTLVTGSVGSDDNIAQFRHGAKLNDQWFGRFHLRSQHTDESQLLQGGGSHDAWRLHQAGFRLDGEVDETNDIFTVQGDMYSGSKSFRTVFPAIAGTPYRTNDLELHGLNLLGRKTHHVNAGEELKFQVYYDLVVRDLPTIFKLRQETYDAEYQHTWSASRRHNWIWGGGFRLTQDELDGSPVVFFTPDAASRRLWTAFVQYDHEAIPDVLNLIAGTKFEYNDFSHFEYQPSVKLLWKRDEAQTFWVSASRATRTPSRSEQDVNLTLSAVGPVQIIPEPSSQSEILYSVDIGHRWDLSDSVSTDVTLFTKRLREGLVPTPQANPLQLATENNVSEDYYGGEFVLDWQPAQWWQLQTWWAYVEPRYSEGSISRNRANIRSYMNLPRGFEVDTTLRYADARTAQNIPSYIEMDVRLGWHATPEVDVSLAFEHLLDKRTVEAPADPFVADFQSEIQRAVSLKVTWTPDF